PENNSNDLFWLFHPKRAMVPSLPLLFGCPETVLPARMMFGRPRIPNVLRCVALAVWLARMALSGISSISPAPNTGVGMRKIAFLFDTAVAKSGWLMLQPGASSRPVIVYRSCTPPSGLPSAFLMKRTSRTGPVAVMNGGTLFLAWSFPAKATCGFTGGLDPPIAGCEWQPPQPSRFMVGPNPSG